MLSGSCNWFQQCKQMTRERLFCLLPTKWNMSWLHNGWGHCYWMLWALPNKLRDAEICWIKHGIHPRPIQWRCTWDSTAAHYDRSQVCGCVLCAINKDQTCSNDRKPGWYVQSESALCPQASTNNLHQLLDNFKSRNVKQKSSVSGLPCTPSKM